MKEYSVSDLLGRNPYSVTIGNPDNNWLNPGQLTLTWNPVDLGGSQVAVDVRLVGYREEGLPGEEEVSTARVSIQLYQYSF